MVEEFDYSRLEKCGEDVYISPNIVWKRPHLARIGSHVAIDDYDVITTAVDIGDYIHVHCHVSIIGGVEGMFKMGHFTTIAAGSRIIVRGDAHMGMGLVSPVIPDWARDEVVGEYIMMNNFSSIGTNVILMPNTWLAEGVVVGANSLVTKPIEEPWTVWVGSPARKIKNRPKARMIEFARELGYNV